MLGGREWLLYERRHAPLRPFRAQMSPEGTTYHQVGELSKDIIPYSRWSVEYGRDDAMARPLNR